MRALASPSPPHCRPLLHAPQVITATHHVAMQNKVGVDPTGEDARLAFELQSGIRTALRAQPADAAGAAGVAGAARTSSSCSSSSDEGGEVVALDAGAFQELRAAFGVNETAFRASVALEAGRRETTMKMIPTRDAAGKSKAFFFLSPDQVSGLGRIIGPNQPQRAPNEPPPPNAK